MTSETIQAQLKTVKYPGFSRDIVSFGLVRDIQIKDANVCVLDFVGLLLAFSHGNGVRLKNSNANRMLYNVMDCLIASLLVVMLHF